MMDHDRDAHAPIAIGGIGGSGTRVIAGLLLDCGYYLGDDLNGSLDNLFFSLIFRHGKLFLIKQGEFDRLFYIFVKSMLDGDAFTHSEQRLVRAQAEMPSPPFDAAWREQLADRMMASSARCPKGAPWGWKEPNTHIFIDRIVFNNSALKYIHVIRNGLDMAFSSNQNQLVLWGRELLNEDFELTPRWSLRFWHLANRRVIDLFKRRPEQFLLLNFDRLCCEPRREIEKMLEFVGLSLPAEKVSALVNTVRMPSSIGRFKNHELDEFSAEDIRYVRSLGFDSER